MKRYYYPNQIVKYKEHTLSITTGGSVYLVDSGVFKLLDSIWLPHTRVIDVSMPDGTELRLKQTKRGLEVINED